MATRRTTAKWHKGIVEIHDQAGSYLSVVFTWDLPKARSIALQLPNKLVCVGGPAVTLLPDYLKDCPNVLTWPSQHMAMLARHNPDACRTTLGCSRGCPFCAVSIVEGPFRELETNVVSPIICDSNFLQSSSKHFNHIIDLCKQLPLVDFNQGLDARLLTWERAERLCELSIPTLRFSWDKLEDERPIMAAVDMMLACGFPKSRIFLYCLVNHTETPEEARYRQETIKARGLTGFPMRYQPLDTLKKNSYVAPQWTKHELKRFCYYWSRQSWLSGVPYDEFHYPPLPSALQQLSLPDHSDGSIDLKNEHTH